MTPLSASAAKANFQNSSSELSDSGIIVGAASDADVSIEFKLFGWSIFRRSLACSGNTCKVESADAV
jgi:hypothetical protein